MLRQLRRFAASPAILNLMYVPALILIFVFIIYPLTQGVKYSFTDWNGYSERFQWVGWDKYTRLLTDTQAPRLY